jgi:PAS domain S-box-containing protein
MWCHPGGGAFRRGRSCPSLFLQYNASTFRDANGNLQGVFAAARDITEQKKLEQQLRESEAYNRGLIGASVDGLVTVDPSGTIMDVNEQMCRMSGFSREELIGTPFADYFADADRATAGVNETFDKGVGTDYVLPLSTRHKRQVRVSFNASIFKEPSGNVRGIFASARDITEQAQLSAQLVADHETLAAVELLGAVIPALEQAGEPPFEVLFTLWLSTMPAVGWGFFS